MPPSWWCRLLLVAAACAAALALPLPQSSSSSSLLHFPTSHQSVIALGHPHDSPQPYNFEYKVHDEKSHNYHERAESSDGQVVRGFYSLLEPHGEVRVVKYRADHGGFQSEVSRHGGRGGPGDATRGGATGATMGAGPAHDIGSHGLGVTSEHVVLATHSAVTHPASSAIKQDVSVVIPIHEEQDESGAGAGEQWSAIEDPARKRHVPAAAPQHHLRAQAIQQVPAPYSPQPPQPPQPPQRAPDPAQLFKPKKPAPLPNKFHGKKPLLGRPRPPLRPGPGHYFHRGPKGGPHHRPHKRGLPGKALGPRARNAVGPPPPVPPAPPPPPAGELVIRRDARPPPSACQCSDPQHHSTP